MNGIEAIGAIESGASGLIAPQRTNGADFMSMVTDGMQRVDAQLAHADQQLRSFAAGEGVAVHDLMISLEQARVGLTLMAEVRNRLVEGYQELTRMQL